MAKANITLDQAKKVASLANLNLSQDQLQQFPGQLTSILDYVSQIQSLDTKDVKETNQVTNLTNVLREDEIDPSRQFTQEEALSNAKKSYQGYFVVDSIFN